MSEILFGRVADIGGITELLYEHSWDTDAGHCECGWSYIDDNGGFTEDHSVHVARVLKDTYDIKARAFPAAGV